MMTQSFFSCHSSRFLFLHKQRCLARPSTDGSVTQIVLSADLNTLFVWSSVQRDMHTLNCASVGGGDNICTQMQPFQPPKKCRHWFTWCAGTRTDCSSHELPGMCCTLCADVDLAWCECELFLLKSLLYPDVQRHAPPPPCRSLPIVVSSAYLMMWFVPNTAVMCHQGV